jgi:hypothetical protein
MSRSLKSAAIGRNAQPSKTTKPGAANIASAQAKSQIGAGCPILAFFARVGFHGGQFLGVLILSGMTKSEAHLRR